MTSSSHALPFTPPAHRALGIRNFNIALMAIILAALVFYVIAANGLSSQAWKTSHAQDQLTGVMEQRNGILEQQAALSDREKLTQLVASIGFVPAGTVVYLMQEGAVAAR